MTYRPDRAKIEDGRRGPRRRMGEPWTAWEDRVVLGRRYSDDMTAFLTERSVSAVRQRRHVLRRLTPAA